jgi:hypothetical protein
MGLVPHVNHPPFLADNVVGDRIMDSNSLMVSLVFGSVGMGMFMYGKKAGRMVPLGAGLALMILPYLIPNAIAASVVSCALMATPWILREA